MIKPGKIESKDLVEDPDGSIQKDLGEEEKRSENPVTRTIKRYLIPRFVVSIYYFLRHRCLISSQSRVQLSSRISFGRGTVVKPFAVIQTQAGRISFGQHCAIGNFNHITNGTQDIIVGNYVRIGPHVTIMGGSRNYKSKELLIMEQGSYHKSVTIGDDVLIGAGVVILPGCQIGEGAVIGALSLVNGDVPPYAIVAGSPARVIGERV